MTLKGRTDDVPRAEGPVRARLDATWSRYLDAVERDADRLASRASDQFPHFTEAGRWTWLSVDQLSGWGAEGVYEHGNWTAGFWLGTLSLLESARPGTVEERTLESRRAAVAPRATDTTTHDLGFLFYPGPVIGSRIGVLPPTATIDASRAAATLARRYNHAGQFIQAFGPIGGERSAGSSTIDTMMNLPLLWWAGMREPGTPYVDIARRHARTSARLFLRPDATTFHLLRFNPVTGAVERRGTFQGSADDSCWSRGQSWAICGFAWAFAFSGESEVLAAADATARAFWERLPDSGVPPWDFSDTSADASLDASAGAIAALGALILGELHPDAEAARTHRDRGEWLLVRLGEGCLSSDPSIEGALQRSCYSRPSGLGIDGAVAWGDFYFGLALAVAVDAVDLHAVLGLSPVDSSLAST